jgi:hypothetical protein
MAKRLWTQDQSSIFGVAILFAQLGAEIVQGPPPRGAVASPFAAIDILPHSSRSPAPSNDDCSS